MLDYKELGLKIGLEIHQQLSSNRKLFCYCPPQLIDREPDIRVFRFQRPTLSETGELDPTLEKAFKKKKMIVYEMYSDLCLYEIDEKPPGDVDRYSLITALLLAKIFQMKIPDMLFVSRKQYLDGSVPSGFQRTILVGLDGRLKLSNGKEVKIEQLCLEEDAARKISESQDEVIFRVDRLGIPLVEITTGADMETPDEALDCALRIGAILRATRRVRRGLGTIRQDINVSIKGGTRVEIKGVQYPEWFKPLIDNEIIRQQNLIKIARILKERNVSVADIENQEPKDITKLFNKTKAKFIKRALSRGHRVLALRLPKFGGLLGMEIQKGRRFGKEFAERVKVIVGLQGIIHTDELPAYGITKDEKQKLFIELNADPEEDVVVFVVGPKNMCLEALEEVKERAKQALMGPPPETRRANPDGTTSFERPLGGAGRLYPDTDSPPIIITQELLDEANKIQFRYPWEMVEELVSQYAISRDDARRIVFSEYFPIFNKLKKLGLRPQTFLRILNNIVMLRRKGFDTTIFDEDTIEKILLAYVGKRITKEALDEIMEYMAKNKEKNFEKAIATLGVKKVSEDEVRRFIMKLLDEKIDFIKERREHAFKPLMGIVMSKYRGKLDGKIIARILKEELDKILEKIQSSN